VYCMCQDCRARTQEYTIGSEVMHESQEYMNGSEVMRPTPGCALCRHLQATLNFTAVCGVGWFASLTLCRLFEHGCKPSTSEAELRHQATIFQQSGFYTMPDDL
jgi:hypothetical protein